MDIKQLQIEAAENGRVLMKKTFLNRKSNYESVRPKDLKVRKGAGWSIVENIIEPTTVEKVVALNKEATKVVDDSLDLNDLTIVEGVGKAIDKHLKENGVNNLSDLASLDAEQIKSILVKKSSLKRHVPTTWASQAQMAVNGELDKLKEWQSQLIDSK